MAANLPPPLEASSPPPPLFDGTTRLYTSYTCPFAQRVWITRNYKGLQEKIELVGINLQNRPDWYKEKVNPANKVPALEHDGKIIVESLDLIKYVDSNFEGPSLYPDEPAKREFGEELLTYVGEFVPKMYGAFKAGDTTVADPEFNYLEKALEKFDDGPFFLGQFSLVDIAYAPFIERFNLVLADVWKYDFTAGRPKLAKWWEELNKIEAYKETKTDPEYLLAYFKNRFVYLELKFLKYYVNNDDAEELGILKLLIYLACGLYFCDARYDNAVTTSAITGRILGCS
ncbi:hypothetical protein V2J09_012046 [Rumex salicifolius]